MTQVWLKFIKVCGMNRQMLTRCHNGQQQTTTTTVDKVIPMCFSAKAGDTKSTVPRKNSRNVYLNQIRENIFSRKFIRFDWMLLKAMLVKNMTIRVVFVFVGSYGNLCTKICSYLHLHELTFKNEFQQFYKLTINK